MTIVRLVEQDDGRRLRASFPYDPDAVSTVKRHVPSTFRSYDSSSKSWLIDAKFGEELTEALMANGHTVLFGDDATTSAIAEPGPDQPVEQFFVAGSEKATKAKVRAEDRAYAELIIAKVPANRIHGVFRQMSRVLYPELFAR